MTGIKMDSHERQRLAQCYQLALEAGDFAVVQSVLALAEQDSRLEDLLLEVNENRLITLQGGFAQASAPKSATPNKATHQNKRESHRTFWTVAAASLVTVLLGIVLITSRIPQLQTLVVAPAAPLPSFTQHGLITSENLDQLQPFARLGNGMMTGMHMMPDGEYLLIAATTGLYLHDAHDLSAEPQQIYAGTIGYYSDLDDNGYLYGIDESLNAPQAQGLTVSRWNTVTGERTDFLQLDNILPSELMGLKVKPDGTQVIIDMCVEFRLVATFSSVCQQRAYVWYDTINGQQIYALNLPVGNTWGGFAVSNDWSTFAYAVDADDRDTQNEPTIQFMNMETYETKAVVIFDEPRSVLDGGVWAVGTFAFSPDSQYLVVQQGIALEVSSAIYDVDRLWETNEPVNFAVNTLALYYRTSQLVNPYLEPAFLSDSRSLITLSETQVFRYNLIGDEERLESAAEADLMPGYPPSIIAPPILSPDDSTLYIRYQGNIVMAYNAATLRKVDEMAYYQNSYDENFQFTSDGSQVVIHAGGYIESIPDIWTINVEPPIHETFLPDENLTPVNQFAFSPDGTRLAYQVKDAWVRESNLLWIQDISSQSQPFPLIGRPELGDIQFLQDGRLLGLSINSQVILWSSEAIANPNPELIPQTISMREVSYSHYDFTGARPIAVAPSGQWFAVAICGSPSPCGYNGFDLWDIENGEQVLTIRDDNRFKRFGAIAFSPDSQLVAYGYCREMREVVSLNDLCAAGEVRFYTLEALLNHQNGADVPPLEPQFTLTGFAGLPVNIAFNPIQQNDGSWLVAITEPNTQTQLWRVNPDGTSELLRTLETVRQSVAFDPTGGLMFTTADNAQTEVWGVPLIETANP